MQTLNAKDLKHMLDKKDDFVLINVLPEESFDQAHIPGSLNFPLERDDFTDQVEAVARNKSRKIVVYCASKDCEASPTAAKKLRDAGYTDVHHFEDGMDGWRKAGYEVASTAGVTS